MMLLDRQLYFPVSQILDLAVDTERQIAARLGRANTSDVFDNMALAILDYALAARFATKLIL